MIKGGVINSLGERKRDWRLWLVQALREQAAVEETATDVGVHVALLLRSVAGKVEAIGDDAFDWPPTPSEIDSEKILALIAATYKAAAKRAMNWVDEAPFKPLEDWILALTPADAQTALDTMLTRARMEGAEAERNECADLIQARASQARIDGWDAIADALLAAAAKIRARHVETAITSRGSGRPPLVVQTPTLLSRMNGQLTAQAGGGDFISEASENGNEPDDGTSLYGLWSEKLQQWSPDGSGEPR